MLTWLSLAARCALFTLHVDHVPLLFILRVCPLFTPPPVPTLTHGFWISQKGRSGDSLEIFRQVNFSFEPMIRQIIGKHRFFHQKRLIDYAAEIAMSGGNGDKIQVVVIIEIEANLSNEEMQQMQMHTMQTELKGMVVAVDYKSGEVEVTQWMNPPAPKKSSRSSSRSVNSDGSGSATKSLHQSVHLQKLARSLVKSMRRKGKATATKLSNDAVIKQEAVKVMENEVYEFAKVVMGERDEDDY